METIPIIQGPSDQPYNYRTGLHVMGLKGLAFGTMSLVIPINFLEPSSSSCSITRVAALTFGSCAIVIAAANTAFCTFMSYDDHRKLDDDHPYKRKYEIRTAISCIYGLATLCLGISGIALTVLNPCE